MEQGIMLMKLRELGCDVAGAMNRMMQDESFYRDCLTAFADDPLFSQLGETLRDRDAHTAFEHAHALKGVSANLGLTPLCETVGLLVELLRAGRLDGADELYMELLARLHALRECLSA